MGMKQVINLLYDKRMLSIFKKLMDEEIENKLHGNVKKLNDEDLTDLTLLLSEAGYSDNTIKEILR